MIKSYRYLPDLYRDDSTIKVLKYVADVGPFWGTSKHYHSQPFIRPIFIKDFDEILED